MSETNKGDWAVAVRDANTGKGYFVHQAVHVDEQAARKAFGLVIRAIEFELPIDIDETDAIKASAVRLLHWDYEVIAIDNGDALIDAEGGWKVVQEHQGGVIARWEQLTEHRPGKAPYREDAFHPGVPCHPGAWGSPNACAMHWGLPLDDEHGMCVEGKRGAKVLGLILVPMSMQTKWGMRQTMTHDELQFDRACIVAEKVIRGLPCSDAEVESACQTLELAIAKANRRRA